MSSSLKSRSEVRDASRITPYKPKEISQYEDEVDYYPLGAMLASVMGVFSKSKWWCCVSVILAVASLATMKRSTTDVKQVFMTLLFSIFALFSAYLNPNNFMTDDSAAHSTDATIDT